MSAAQMDSGHPGHPRATREGAVHSWEAQGACFACTRKRVWDVGWLGGQSLQAPPAKVQSALYSPWAGAGLSVLAPWRRSVEGTGVIHAATGSWGPPIPATELAVKQVRDWQPLQVADKAVREV